MMTSNDFFDRCADKFPLAVATRVLLERTLAPKVLDDFFELVAREQYVKSVLFSDLVALMSTVVHRMHRSVHAAYFKSSAASKIKLSALYDKINNIEPRVSAAFVADHAKRLIEVLDQINAPLAPLIPGFETRILDGNAIAATDHRLEVLRDTRSGPLPGKSLAILDYERDVVTQLIMCEDGHAQERSLSNEILEQVQPGQAWIADRNFCTAKILCGIVNRGGEFLIREHRNIPIMEESSMDVIASDGNGHLKEGSVSLSYENSQPIIFRRIWLTLPKASRDGDREIVVLTTIPREKASAHEIMEAYRKRWTIESMFANLTVSLCCEVRALGHPRAALFLFANAVVAANTLSGVRAALRAQHGEDIEERVSVYQMVDDLQSSFRSTDIIEDSFTDVESMPIVEFTKHFLAATQRIDIRQYRKAKTRPRKTPHTRGKSSDPPHVSTYRLLEEKKRARHS